MAESIAQSRDDMIIYDNNGRELGSIAQFLGGKNIYRTTIWDGREQSSIAL